MMRAHQPGSRPLDIPEAIPNPAVPQTTPSHSPSPREPVKVPARQRAASESGEQAGGRIPWGGLLHDELVAVEPPCDPNQRVAGRRGRWDATSKKPSGRSIKRRYGSV
jgi:hypothetical protein